MARDVLVLASASPRRAALLAEWGVRHEVVVPAVDESSVSAASPSELTEALARTKALAVVASDPALASRFILAADTVVVVAGRVLGKPRDDTDALATLNALSGSTVRVITGIAVLAPAGAAPVSDHDVSEVVMHPFTPEEAAVYVATGEPRGKAGSFAAQGRGARLIARIVGSTSNVIGLPRRKTRNLLVSVTFSPHDRA